MHKDPRKPSSYFLIIILLGGLFVGAGLSWAIYVAPSYPKEETTTSAPTGIPETTQNPSGTKPQSVVEVGKRVQDFSLKDVSGEEISFSSFSGKPVVINLWTSWCIPCQNEMPELQKIYDDNKESGLMVLGINVTSQDDIQNVKDTMEQYHISYPILLDESGDVARLLKMYGIPTSYFIDSQGILRRIQIGEIRPEDVDHYLAEILPRN